MTFAGAIVVIVLGSWLFARSISAIITQVVTSLQAAANRDYTVKVKKTTGGDLGRLITSTNWPARHTRRFRETGLGLRRAASPPSARRRPSSSSAGRHGGHRQRQLPEHAGLLAGRDPGPAPQPVRRAGLPRVSPNTAQFWDKLGRGEYDAGQYKRIGKGGKEVWIQASYNPILDTERQAVQGRQVRHRRDRRRSCRPPTTKASSTPSARRRPSSSSTSTARSSPPTTTSSTTLGYSLDEIKGKHHSMFVEPAYTATSEYRAFWDEPRPRRVRRRPSTSASARAARRSGSRPPTTRSSTSTASRSRSSSTRPT